MTKINSVPLACAAEGVKENISLLPLKSAVNATDSAADAKNFLKRPAEVMDNVVDFSPFRLDVFSTQKECTALTMDRNRTRVAIFDGILQHCELITLISEKALRAQRGGFLCSC